MIYESFIINFFYCRSDSHRTCSRTTSTRLERWPGGSPAQRPEWKGQCHEMDIFWRSKHFNQYFLRMRWWFPRSFKTFHYPIQLLNFSLCLWNHWLILKMLTGTLPRIPFFVIVRCPLVLTSHWLQGKCARINLSQAVSGVILQNHRRLCVSISSFKIRAYTSLLLWAFTKIFISWHNPFK